MMYAFVLSTATMVTIIGLGALLATRARFASTIDAESGLQARWCAHAAVQVGLQRIRSSSYWRGNYPQGNWFVDVPLGQGRYALHAARVPDADGNPYNDTWILTGTGRCGGAVQRVQVLLVNGAIPGEWIPKVD